MFLKAEKAAEDHSRPNGIGEYEVSGNYRSRPDSARRNHGFRRRITIRAAASTFASRLASIHYGEAIALDLFAQVEQDVPDLFVRSTVHVPPIKLEQNPLL
jgi:hypothetical protein